MNFSDSERIASFLENYKFKLTQKIEKADLVIFNTCGVRQMAEDRVYGQTHNLQKKIPTIKIVLTGCVAMRPDVQKRLATKVDLFCQISNFNKDILPLLEEIQNKKQNNNSIKNIISTKDKKTISNQENIAYLATYPKYSNKFSANIPIMTGCNNFCAYCVVPYARGREVSRSAEEILTEIKKLIKNNYREIILLGQNVNSYQGTYQDKKINFSKLLKLVNSIPGNFWIRFVSSHPKDMTDDLITTITKLKKVCECVHLPIQAGDNMILKKMNRKYTRQHYLELIKKIKKSFQKNKPNKIFAITSDIIVGFPSETKSQFKKSAEVMLDVNYDMVYFGQFSPRPGTTAWNMKDNISKKEKVRREKFLNEILKKTCLENNRKYLDKTFTVLIKKKKNNFYYGETRTLKNVKLPIPKNTSHLIGNFAKIKITKANIWNLEGEINL